MTADILEPVRSNSYDPVEDLPPPETISQLLGEARRRCELLKSLLVLSRRKAKSRPIPQPQNPVSREVSR